MTDLEISKALALAIGWKPEQIIEYEGQEYIGLPAVILRPAIKLFSYKYWNVIGPIAERYYTFPERLDTGVWWVQRIGLTNLWVDVCEETPQKAIALAVIKGSAT